MTRAAFELLKSKEPAIFVPQLDDFSMLYQFCAILEHGFTDINGKVYAHVGLG